MKVVMFEMINVYWLLLLMETAANDLVTFAYFKNRFSINPNVTI